MSINIEKFEQIKSHCQKTNANLIAVTKTQSIASILELYHLGQKIMGENKAQELCKKYEELPKDIQWHFIGHLQSNKVEDIIDKVILIHSVDSLKLLQTIDREASKIGKTMNILLQVHIAQEEHKYGFSKEEILEFFSSKTYEQFPHVAIKGLMGMATQTEDMDEIRNEFKTLYQIKQTIETEHAFSLKEISMGMSGDYSIALEEGSTMIRVGSLLFK